ncbi:MAG: replication initiation protein [Paludibacteraceae bacterium]|nr:replication initiation protein [Paludibacteraceae bacterium]
MRRSNNPLTDNMGQILHQTVHTEQGQVVDLDEQNIDIVDSNGLPVPLEEEQRIAEIKKSITIEQFMETFHKNAHQTLENLLALQDNLHPLKKGGKDIAYRTNILIMHCKMNFTSDENIVFDAILGTMSSNPENESYRIEPADFFKFSKHSKPEYLYSVFHKGANKLKEKRLVFEGLGPDGEDDLEIQWFEALRYHNRKKADASAYIEFVPTAFFKDLALCAGLVHGAFGSLEVTMQLSSKYSFALYWFFENMKNYKMYPNATEGMFRMSIEKLKSQFFIPESYSHNDIVKRVLEPAKSEINSVEECDFTFEYEPQKMNGKFAGYLFTIKKKQLIDAEEPKLLDTNDALYGQIRTFLEAFEIEMSEADIEKVYLKVKSLNKDAMFVTSCLMQFKNYLSDNKVSNNVNFLCKLMENEVNIKQKKKAQTKFHDFSYKNDYNYDDLEDKLLDN